MTHPTHRIDRSDASRLMESTLAGARDLSCMRLSADEIFAQQFGQAPDAGREAAIAYVADRFTTAIDGADDEVSRRCHAAMLKAPHFADAAIDGIALALLLHHGIDAAALVMVETGVPSIRLRGHLTLDPGTLSATDGEPTLDWNMALGDDLVWTGRGTLFAGGIPEQIKVTLPGRRLTDIVSHPVLDAYDLEIEDYDSMGRLTELKCRGGARPVRLDRLAPEQTRPSLAQRESSRRVTA